MKRLILFIGLVIIIACQGQTKKTSNTKTVNIEYLSNEVLLTKSKEELRFIRNEIFARKGYVFKSEDLNSYFKSKPWYAPDANAKISLSDEEQNYIYKVKILEGSFSSKSSHCPNELSHHLPDLYPIRSNELLNRGFKYNSMLDAKVEDVNEIVYGNLCAGGYVWNVKCYVVITYQLMFYNCVDDDPFVKLAIIKSDNDISFLELYGSSLFGEDTIDSYYDTDFKLNQDSLEVYKIFKELDQENITEENQFPVKEVRREVTKYKLTDQGIVEL